jgi:hypothetical protein
MRLMSKWIWVGIASFSLSNPVFACATLISEGEPPVRIKGETALIVWDKTKGIEHFIRRASFQSKSRDFGFLVPTPSRPVLASADEAMFATLQSATLPKRETRDKWSFSLRPLIFGPPTGPVEGSTDAVTSTRASANRSVEVLENKRVGSYQAAILSASDAGTLQKWLKTNGYAASPDLKNWLAPYIENGWIITAFKISKQAKTEVAEAEAVRLSFPTKRPFYPYREPATAHASSGQSRNLRVYFVGDERVVGEIEAPNAPKWPGKVAWSDTLESGTSRQFAAQFQSKNPLPTRMTVFDDHSSPRPGVGELYFAADENQDSVTPPPIIEWKERILWLPADFLALLTVILWNIGAHFKKRSTSDFSENAGS